MKKLNLYRLNLVVLTLLTGLLLFPVVSQAQTTMAYWRFENPTDSNYVPKDETGYSYYESVPDLSGNGNHLAAWEEGGGGGFEYTNDLPASTLPLNGVTNEFSIRNSGDVPGMTTMSSESSPVDANDVEEWSPDAFTIEISFMPRNGGHRTYLGRDGSNVNDDNADTAPVYFQLYPNNTIAFKYADIEGNWHQVTSEPGYIESYAEVDDPNAETGHWYSAVAVSDGGTLRLYFDDLEDDYGWELVDEVELDPTYQGSTAMATAGDTSGGEWHGGAWTVGRGMYGGGHADRGYGFVDEIRLTDGNLDPNQWLFSPAMIITDTPEDQAVEADTEVNLTIGIQTESTSLEYQWYKSSDPNADPSNDTEITEATSATLTIPSMSLSDEGYYYCVITDTSNGDFVYSRPSSVAVARERAKWTLSQEDYHASADSYTDSGSEDPDTDNLTVVGEPNFVSGIDGDANSAIHITDGNGAGYADSFNPSAYSNELTVSFWLNWDGSNDAWQTLVAKRTLDYDVAWSINTTDSPDIEFRNIDSYILAEDVLTDNGQWQHIVATCDGNTGQIYVDGSLAAEGDFALEPTDAAPVCVGALTDGSEFLTGALDETSVFNYAMTDLDIAEMYYNVTGEKPCVESERPEFDFNGDCIVDFKDFALFAEWWMYSGYYEAQ